MSRYAAASLMLIIAAKSIPCADASDTTSDTSKRFESRLTWLDLNWADAGNSAVWRDPAWKRYAGPQETGRTQTLAQESALFGSKATLMLGIYDSAAASGKFWAAAKSEVPLDECKRLATSASSAYGQAIYNDGSYTVRFKSNLYVAATNFKYQWDIGPTRVTASCLSIRTSETPKKTIATSQFLIRYAPADAEKKLVPKFALSCKPRFDGSDRKTPSAAESIANDFWVDTDMMTIKSLSNDLMSSGKRLTITDDEISFYAKSAKGTTTHYRILRKTGGLTGTLGDSGTGTVRVSGNCAVIVPR